MLRVSAILLIFLGASNCLTYRELCTSVEIEDQVPCFDSYQGFMGGIDQTAGAMSMFVNKANDRIYVGLGGAGKNLIVQASYPSLVFSNANAGFDTFVPTSQFSADYRVAFRDEAGDFGYFVSYAAGGCSIKKFDLAQDSLTVVNELVLSGVGNVQSGLITTDGTQAFLLSDTDIVVVDLTGNMALSETLPTGQAANMLTSFFVQNQTFIIIGTDDGTILKFDVANKTVTHSLSVGAGQSFYTSVRRKEKYALFPSFATQKIYMVSLDDPSGNLTLLGTMKGIANPVKIRTSFVSDNGDYAYIVTYRDDGVTGDAPFTRRGAEYVYEFYMTDTSFRYTNVVSRNIPSFTNLFTSYAPGINNTGLIASWLAGENDINNNFDPIIFLLHMNDGEPPNTDIVDPAPAAMSTADNLWNTNVAKFGDLLSGSWAGLPSPKITYIRGSDESGAFFDAAAMTMKLVSFQEINPLLEEESNGTEGLVREIQIPTSDEYAWIQTEVISKIASWNFFVPQQQDSVLFLVPPFFEAAEAEPAPERRKGGEIDAFVDFRFFTNATSASADFLDKKKSLDYPKFNISVPFDTNSVLVNVTINKSEWNRQKILQSGSNKVRVRIVFGAGSSGESLSLDSVTNVTTDEGLAYYTALYNGINAQWEVIAPQLAETVFKDDPKRVDAIFDETELLITYPVDNVPRYTYPFVITQKLFIPPIEESSDDGEDIALTLLPLWIVMGIFCCIFLILIIIVLVVILVIGAYKFNKYRKEKMEGIFSKAEKALADDDL